MFATEGEPWFRELEHHTVAELARGQDAVVALGGGALTDPRTRAVLRHARVVYLHVSFDEAMTRVQADTFRPMLRRPDLHDIFQSRLPVYEDLAALVVDTDGRRADAVAMDVLTRLNPLPPTPPGSSSVFVTPVGGAYYAHIGPDLLTHLDTLIPPVPEAEHAILVEAQDDPAPADIVATQLARRGLHIVRIPVPDTETAKTLTTVEHIAEAFADHAIHKGDLVIAIGGEAVCDLTGFVAATFNRGMRWALVPTTLAGQADSAVGGKNGINLTRGRNLLGSIHQPIAVISDVNLARTRPHQGWRAGLAEIAKHALISPSTFLDYVTENTHKITTGDPETIREVTARSIEIKADIVSRDEHEHGDRVYLNYGHTFAHAMDLIHTTDQGDTLALGLMAAAWLAYRTGHAGPELVHRHHDLLTALGLPTHGRFPLDAMREAWKRDKKYRHGVRFIILDAPGQPRSGIPADDETLAQVLTDLTTTPS